MSHLMQDEYNSIMAASPEIGAWLETLGKTDMAQMSYEEWLDFLAFIYTRICAHNAERWANDVPF